MENFERAARRALFAVQERIPLQSETFREILRQLIANLSRLQAEAIEEKDLIDLENALAVLA